MAVLNPSRGGSMATLRFSDSRIQVGWNPCPGGAHDWT
jgi:hypothetical protein